MLNIIIGLVIFVYLIITKIYENATSNKFASGSYFDYLTIDENTLLEKGLYYENVRCKFDSKASIPSIIYGIEQYWSYPSETSRIQYILYSC